MALLKDYKIEKRDVFSDMYNDLSENKNPKHKMHKHEAEGALIKLFNTRNYKSLPGIIPEKVDDYKKLIKSANPKDFSLYKECFNKNTPVIIYGDNVCGEIINAIIIAKEINRLSLRNVYIKHSIILTDGFPDLCLDCVYSFDTAVVVYSTDLSCTDLILTHANGSIILDSIDNKLNYSVDSDCSTVRLYSSNNTFLTIYRALISDITIYEIEKMKISGLMHSKILISNRIYHNVKLSYLRSSYKVIKSDIAYEFLNRDSCIDMSATVEFTGFNFQNVDITCFNKYYDVINKAVIEFNKCTFNADCEINASDVKFIDSIVPTHCPINEDFIGYKLVNLLLKSDIKDSRNQPIKFRKAYEFGILKLHIPKDAIVRNSCSKKCRSNKVTPVKLYNYYTGEPMDHPENFKIYSTFDHRFLYEIGESIVIGNFDDSNSVCSSGIHFFYKPIDLLNYIVELGMDQLISNTQGIRKIIEAESF